MDEEQLIEAEPKQDRDNTGGQRVKNLQLRSLHRFLMGTYLIFVCVRLCIVLFNILTRKEMLSQWMMI